MTRTSSVHGFETIEEGQLALSDRQLECASMTKSLNGSSLNYPVMPESARAPTS